MLGEKLRSWLITGARRAWADIAKGAHVEAVRALKAAFPGLRLSAITGMDLGEELALYYHLRLGGSLITLRMPLGGRERGLTVQSLTGLIPGADLHEREAYDMLGVRFEGHPDLRRLLLPDDAPEDYYPLRKDVDAGVLRRSKTTPKLTPIVTEEKGPVITLVIGPQHPALHEPERFVFKVDGEVVVDVDIRIGYAHRGIERAAQDRTYIHDLYLCERVCGICNVAHSLCYCLTVEELMGLEVPRRAQFLRVIAAELNRLHSHMLLLGVAAEEMGFTTLFMYIWRDRETVMELMEMLAGNRVISSFNRIGGVSRNLTPSLADKMKKRLSGLRRRLEHYIELFETDPTITARTEGIGTLSPEDAVELCATGPTLRASGISFDVRADDPYAAYGEISAFRPVVRKECDNWGRYMARLEECLVSIDVIEEAASELPGGHTRVRAPRRVRPGEAVCTVEAPRGELLYYIRSDGTDKPARLKIRTPTFTNLAPLRKMLEGVYIADIPVTLASIDPCFSCTDRALFVDINTGETWSCYIDEIGRAVRR